MTGSQKFHFSFCPNVQVLTNSCFWHRCNITLRHTCANLFLADPLFTISTVTMLSLYANMFLFSVCSDYFLIAMMKVNISNSLMLMSFLSLIQVGKSLWNACPSHHPPQPHRQLSVVNVASGCVNLFLGIMLIPSKSLINCLHQLMSLNISLLIHVHLFPGPNLFNSLIILDTNTRPALTVLLAKFNFPKRLCTSFKVAFFLVVHSFRIALISAKCSWTICIVIVSVLNRIPRKMQMVAGAHALFLDSHIPIESIIHPRQSYASSALSLTSAPPKSSR